MKKLIFLLLVSIQLLHAQKKSVPVINDKVIKVDTLLWDMKALSKAPEIEWLNKTGNVYSLFYKGVDYNGKPTQVFAYYSNPDLILGKTQSKTKFPGVVLLHGGGGKAFKEWVEKWAAEGYAAIAMDFSGKQNDVKTYTMPGPEQGDLDKFLKLETGSDLKNMWTYQAVANAILAHSLLLSFPEVETTKTCLTGISWGGYLTCLVGSLDNRFKAAVPVYGCAFYDESDIFKVPLAKLSPAVRKKWMKYFDPSSYMPYAKPQFLFVNGNKDRFYNVIPYDKTYKLIPEAQRSMCLIPDMKHGHEVGWEPHEIRYFFENVINQTAPLSKVKQIVMKDSSLTASYSSPVSLRTADFYYSNDTTSLNENRVWSSKKVQIDSKTKTLYCPVPKERFKYGFFYLKDHRNVSASSEFIIN
ncbi:alpha/beta hydrolase family protein [Dyadobacter frigoris]|uniref:Acylamino acid-releasing protein n=1 Tax=Dyadobacter frigoris TaxID=2576211 RepID=A0A4U6CZN4_9BACT|nr:acetylxylan esterase [Dyadobacter frigoris]TKT86934.1 acylamino acid-releasing protein [Dyadobacter frigoris]GLU56561.1 hypothetical protein Dfri01_60220 [Dyadobacter frigoris]